MIIQITNCSRCGKPAKLLKAWEEKVVSKQGVSLIKHEKYVCQDPDCQKMVEATLKQRQALAAERELASQQREDARIAARSAAAKKRITEQ